MIDFNFGLTFDSLKTIFRMVLDISIMWMLLYYSIKIVRTNSRTIQIFKGIALILVVNSGAKFLGLETVIWLSDQFLNWGVLAIIVVFQPEIRSILEKLGKSNVFSRISTLTGNEKEKLVDELVTATTLLARNQTGALISLEEGQSLNDFIKTGTPINSIVTAELLTSIFVTSTPLHDGAVIIQGDRIACASAYFPPTNLDLPSRYGARHRAAIGISEITDAITIVVSEETGGVSITEAGKIVSVNRKQLREYLIRTICGEETEVKNVKQAAQPTLIIEKEVDVEEVKPSTNVPAQEYIVDEKPIVENGVEEKVVEEKRDSKFDTAILSKLAIKRQATEEEQAQFVDGEVHEEKVEAFEEVTVDEPVVEKKEKKKFGFFKSKKKEKPEKVNAFDALDEEAASIKLPKKKNKAEKQQVESTFVEDVKETQVAKEASVEKAQDSLMFDEIVPQKFTTTATNKFSFDTEEFSKQESKPTQTFFSTEPHVRAMGFDDQKVKQSTNDHVVDVKVKSSESMIHPVHDSKLEDIIESKVKKPETKAAFKVEFNDREETANLSGLTGEVKRSVVMDSVSPTSRHQNLEDLIDDENLGSQFAMLDTMNFKKINSDEIFKTTSANGRAKGDNHD